MKKEMNITLLACALALSPMCAQSQVSVARYKGDCKAAISYTFDDGLLEQYTELFPQLKKYGIKASFCVNGNTINKYEHLVSIGDTTDVLIKEKPRMTWQMMREMSDQGQEITSHGWAHKNVKKLDGEALRYEVQHNDTVIWEHTGVFPRTYFYPGNAKSPEKVAYCEQNRVGTRTEQVSIGSKRDEAWLQQWVEGLIKDQKWGVGMTHGISRGYDHFKNPQVLWNHFNYISGMRDKVWVGTFHDVAAYVKERDAIKLKTKVGKNEIVVTPSIKLNKEIFNEPLTLVVNHTLLSATQDGKALAVSNKNGKGIVDFDPHGGKVILTMGKDYDLTQEQGRYSDQQGYGYDFVDGKKYFSMKLPEGNYRVTVTLGSKKQAGNTVVRAEDRRLLLEDIKTKKGELRNYTFTINRRSPKIDDKRNILLTPRENKYLNWDNKLTLEFNGENPVVSKIHVEAAPDTIPVLYLCGNSTVVDQRNEPWASWGQMITRWFDDGAVVVNHAQSGLTAGSFLNQRRLEKILTTLKPGDYVLCEFGHNDQKGHRPGDGAWYSFTHNLKIFIDEVRQRGANIILATPTRRRKFENGQIVNTHGDFPAAIRTIAEREHVPVIDLQTMTKTFFETLGEENSKKALVHYPAHTWPKQGKALADNTHFNPYGAYEVAKMIVMGMKQLGLPLVNHLRKDWKDFDPAHPDDFNTWHWYPSAMTDMTKPAGN